MNQQTNAINLFHFLHKLTTLKSKKILDVDNFEKILWLKDIPREKESYSVTHTFDADLSNYDKWIELKKPRILDYPKLPNAIHKWVKEDTLQDWTSKPILYDYILKDKIEKNEVEEKIFLKNIPKIESIFSKYYEKDWKPWAKERIRLRPVLDIYNTLFEIYHKNKTQGENYQFVLGVGLLSTKNSKEKTIKRHIITAPLSIEFHSTIGTITVGPGDQVAELSLELDDILETSEQPDNSDAINSKLKEFENDFWNNEDFHNQLKSWIHRYNAKGTFYKHLGIEHIKNSDCSLSLSPAIILRKRGDRSFSKFYNDIIKDIESKDSLPNSLRYIFDSTNDNNSYKDKELFFISQSQTFLDLQDEYYFPFPTNDEQKSIMQKLSKNIGIIIQGPPGTGKTHSIANLICHLLATGKNILITSQTDRALKVLKDKLPNDIKGLCVEILGRDQKSILELKNSVTSINSKFQDFDCKYSEKKIQKLKEKHENSKRELEGKERRILEIKQFETRLYEKRFGNYSGTPGSIVTEIKKEKNQYGWIENHFILKDSNTKSPLSNDDAVMLWESLKKIKTVSSDILEESLEFLDSCLGLSDFKDKIQDEKKALQVIEESSIDNKIIRDSVYNNIFDTDFVKAFDILFTIVVKTKRGDSSSKNWKTKVLRDCIAGKQSQCKSLLETTEDILDSTKKTFLSIDKITVTNIPDDLDIIELSKLLKDFFKRFKETDKIRSFFPLFSPKEFKKVKRVIKDLKIDGFKCDSYQSMHHLKNWIAAKISKKKLSDIWQGKEDITVDNFKMIYHEYKDLCKDLKEYLKVHSMVKDFKTLLKQYPSISQADWSLESIKNEFEIIKVIKAKKTREKTELEFKRYIELLSQYRGQKNRIAINLIEAYRERSIEIFEEALKDIANFIENKKIFEKIIPIKGQLDVCESDLFKKLRNNIDDPKWESSISKFEESWTWYQTKRWIKENEDSDFLKSLMKERGYLILDIQKKVESLVSEMAWKNCLSRITDKQRASLKGWSYAISKIGKGTGKTANKHRKIARQKMLECKEAIPVWIMPLYRIVENIQPGTELFDVAIIDEASQTGPEGLLLNYLAKRIIVVGDNEQISPEMLGLKDDDVELLKKKYLSNLNYSEHIGREYSYYDYCDISFKNHIQLREHFRCMPEIIKFSNSLSYSGQPLIPMRQYGSSRLEPLKSTFIESALSKVGDADNPQNQNEAEEIVTQLNNCINDTLYENKTFGIISLQGKMQVNLITKILEDKVDKEEIEKRDIIVGTPYDFQGDERNVIFLSMAIASDYNFRALTRDTHKKRYNVAASRAKDQMWLFHSIRPDELSPYCFRKKFLQHCMTYKEEGTGWSREDLQKLTEKIKETKNKEPRNAPDPFDSWFEARVFLEIANRGYLVMPQYPVSRYRIDMVVIGSNKRLAVECDGDDFHSEEHEENDLNRQWNLERCGWNFCRIPYSSFSFNQTEALKGLWETLEKMQIHPS